MEIHQLTFYGIQLGEGGRMMTHMNDHCPVLWTAPKDPDLQDQLEHMLEEHLEEQEASRRAGEKQEGDARPRVVKVHLLMEPA